MAITQTRMIALINAAGAYKDYAELMNLEINDILARHTLGQVSWEETKDSIYALINAARPAGHYLETIITERTHFKLKFADNVAAARKMASRRALGITKELVAETKAAEKHHQTRPEPPADCPAEASVADQLAEMRARRASMIQSDAILPNDTAGGDPLIAEHTIPGLGTITIAKDPEGFHDLAFRPGDSIL